ncbi:MAG: hypothetical protein A2W00_02210 [Candidatus Eisenbacteria bacterium RBG_16_71_46]|nr:MAG: hypothetical protein A2W00_02210 [Candidatus Eisenbacteria bacterium RBG_16_71_46]
MKDQVHRIEYFALPSSDKPGEGASLHQKLAKEGVNLLAVSAFPAGDGSVQVDLVPENPDAFGKAAKKLGLKLGAPKTAFLFQGTDRAGALSEVLGRLGNANINVRATLAVAAGGHRYGGLLWVAPADVEAAARSLGAVSGATHRA